MATPNAAGAVALIISQYGDFTPDNSQKLRMSPTAVEAVLQQTANNRPCPQPNTVEYPGLPQYPADPNGFDFITATCEGEAGGYTSFYGKGIVDALKVVLLGQPVKRAGLTETPAQKHQSVVAAQRRRLPFTKSSGEPRRGEVIQPVTPSTPSRWPSR